MKQVQGEVFYDHELSIEAYWLKGNVQKFPQHFHEYYVAGYIESGRRQVSCRGALIQAQAGDVVLFNPMESHSCQAVDGQALDYRAINIPAEVLAAALPERRPVRLGQIIVQDDALADAILRLHQMIVEEEAPPLRQQAFVELAALLRPYAGRLGEQAADERLDAVRAYVDEHYQEHLTLEQMAALCGLNKYTLSRAFVRAYGITPYRYLETVRINAAKKLLEAGLEPVGAAMETGFSDQSHFNRFFRQLIGLTPGQYKRLFAEKS